MFTQLKRYERYGVAPSVWIEPMPVHWHILPGAGVLKPVAAKNTGLVEPTVLSLSYGRVIVKPPEKLHGLVPESFETYQVLQPGDIVIRPTDLQNDKTSLRVGLVRDQGIITSAYLGLRASGISTEFAFTYLAALDHMKIFYGMGSGLRQNLDFKDFKRLPVPVPPAKEQASIVKYLAHTHARIDRAIAAKRKLVALLEEQKQATIQQAVTRGLDPSVPLKDSGIPWLGKIPAHWSTFPLSRCFESMVYGTSENARGDGPVTVIGMGDIQSGEVRVSGAGGLGKVPVGLELDPGDLLFNRTNSPNLVGKVGLYKDKRSQYVTFASYLVRLRPSPSFDSKWLVALLNSSDFLRFAQSQALVSLHQANLNPRRYGRLKIPVPPVGERAAIGTALHQEIVKAWTTISAISDEIELLRELRTRLTSDVVTGQVDIREIAETLPELTDDILSRPTGERFGDDDATESERELADANE